MNDKHSKHNSKETLVKNWIFPPLARFLLAPHRFMEEKLLLPIVGQVLHSLLETKIHSALMYTTHNLSHYFSLYVPPFKTWGKEKAFHILLIHILSKYGHKSFF